VISVRLVIASLLTLAQPALWTCADIRQDEAPLIRDEAAATIKPKAVLPKKPGRSLSASGAQVRS